MKVVVDTNVLISGIINPYGKPAKILNLVLERKLVLCVDSRIYNEYEKVGSWEDVERIYYLQMITLSCKACLQRLQAPVLYIHAHLDDHPKKQHRSRHPDVLLAPLLHLLEQL